MRTLAQQARAAHPTSLVTYQWIPREENAHADRLANRALDERNNGGVKPKNLLLERLRMPEVPTMIYFVRHGETILTPERRFSGSGEPNPPLTYMGLAQAALVADEIAKINPEILISSPLLRTRQTAEKLSATTGLAVEFDEAWFECGFGLWDGLAIEEVKERFPNEYREWVSSSSYAPPQGESYDALGWRVDEAIDTIVARHPGKRVVVVTHNGVIKQAVRLSLGADSDTVFHVDISPCSISSISIWPSDGLRALRSVNERGHLR
jgi:probable phosphoglycerate mutase